MCRLASPNTESNKYRREAAQYVGETHNTLDPFHTKPELDSFFRKGVIRHGTSWGRGVGGFLLAASELRDSIGHPGHVFPPPAPRPTGL
jgi:hypothetical protein